MLGWLLCMTVMRRMSRVVGGLLLHCTLSPYLLCKPLVTRVMRRMTRIVRSTASCLYFVTLAILRSSCAKHNTNVRGSFLQKAVWGA